MSLRPAYMLVGLQAVFANLVSGPSLRAEERQPGIAIEAFEPRSVPTGSTMFTALAPERTGIDMANEYADPRMWGDRYQEFALGAIGSGVAVGDYDMDGRPDLFIVNKTGQSRLFRNLGDWKFEDATTRAGLGEAKGGWFDSVSALFGSDDEGEAVEHWKQGATFADVNNDGWLDLYICRFRAPNQLFMNDGRGSFRVAEDAAGLGLSSASGMAAFCDFDRDGWLDVYVQTNMLDSTTSPDGSRDRLYRNNGDGTFSDVTEEAGIAGETLGHSATWWDYNDDGWPDLYVANDFAAPDQLYRNDTRDGKIAFSEVLDSVVPHQPFSSMGADLGDVNNDGRIDFLVADMAPTKHEMDLRGMAVTRHAMRAENPDTKSAPQYMYNALYLNTGVGKMREAAWLFGVARTDWTWSTRFEDLDNDGLLDLHVTNGMVREYQNDDLRQRIFRAEHLGARMRIMHSSPMMSESNLAYRNLGDMTFERVEERWGLGQVGVSFGAGFGDFDGDGDLDLVFSNYDAAPTALRNDSQDGGRAVFVLRGAESNRYGVGATVSVETALGTQTRQLVLARGYLSSSDPSLHFGLGSAERIERATVKWPSGRVQVFKDLAANRRFTVSESSGSAEPESRLRPAPEPLFREVSELSALSAGFEEPQLPRADGQPLAPFTFARRGPALGVGDVNGDGRDDVIMGSFGGRPARLLFGTESGSFQPAGDGLPGGASSSPHGQIIMEDFDGDGMTDALLTAADPSGRGKARLLRNRGRGTFEETDAGALSMAPALAGSASAGDFNGDGSADVFIGSRVTPGRYPQPGRSVLLANRGGVFEDASDLLPDGGELGMVTGSLWSDVDGDGWLDLVVSLEWGYARSYRNANGERFEDRTEEWGFASAGAGFWSALAAGDFNGDGRQDYAVGNLGLNTPYRADKSEPAILYYGDFGGRGPFQIVEGRYESGRLAPWRSRKELGDAIPSVLRRFASNDAYAAASLDAIIGAEALAGARRLEASELRSGVFLSAADGTYRFEPFERMAQLAPIQGLAVADFNGDGNLDLAATQNLYDVDPVIGRFDGGLGQLLLGDGRGGFEAVDPSLGGLVIPGDGKAIVTLDFDGDGWPDLLTTRSDAPAQAFRNVSGDRSR